MNTNTDNSMMIEVPLARNKDGIDVNATVANAKRVAESFSAGDKTETERVNKATIKVLADEQYKDRKSFTAKAIANMVLCSTGQVPTDAAVKEAEPRIKAFMKGQPEKYLNIRSGRSAGWHIISRYDAAELVKLKEVAITANKAAEAKAAEKLAEKNAE